MKNWLILYLDVELVGWFWGECPLSDDPGDVSIVIHGGSSGKKGKSGRPTSISGKLSSVGSSCGLNSVWRRGEYGNWVQWYYG